MTIKHIIYELPAALYQVNRQKTIDAFQKLGAIDLEKFYSLKHQAKFFNELEQGIINAEEFRNNLRTELDIHANDQQIDAAWNAMLVGIDQGKINDLHRIMNSHHIYLMLPLNEIHSKKITKDCEAYRKSTYEEIFKNVHTPHEILNTQNLNPKEMLLFANTPQILEQAQDRHMNTQDISATSEFCTFSCIAKLEGGSVTRQKFNNPFIQRPTI